jgi:hypothetical protein
VKRALAVLLTVTEVACGARSPLPDVGVSCGAERGAEKTVSINVPAESGPETGDFNSTEGATPTGIMMNPCDELAFLSLTGLATYGEDGPPCAGLPETDPSGRTRYFGGVPSCPGKVDQSSVDHGYIGALLFGVDCGSMGTILSWQEAWESPYYQQPRTYMGCAGQLFLLYNDVPGEYDNNAGSYTATIAHTPREP